MADVTINQLGSQAPTSNDVFPFSTTGVTPSTYKATLAQIKTGLALTKTDVGLSLVENKSSDTIRDEITSANVTNALLKQVVSAWVNFSGLVYDAQGNCSIRSQFGVSSVKRNSKGDYTLNFSPSLPGENYALAGFSVAFSSTNVSGTSQLCLHPSGNGTWQASLKTASQVRVLVGNDNTGDPSDSGNISILVLGY
jgi:hypothetical protein